MAFIIKRDGQGIPVSSVIRIWIAFADFPYPPVGYELYDKITNSYFNSFDNNDNEYGLIWNSSTNRWLLSGRGVVATNLTSDSTTIPTSGWIYTTGSGQPIAIYPYLPFDGVGPLPARSIIIKKNTTFKIPRTPFLPSSLGGLALWLKADAGVATFRNAYTSKIILSGGTSSILNKTFVASGTPDPNNYYSYSFGENNGYFITYSQDDTPYYNLRYIAQGTGNIIILNSTDGISWSLVYNMPNTITISGITGTHSSANRTYNLYSYDGDNGIFYFNASGSDYFISTGDGAGATSTNWFLYKVDPDSPHPFLISTGPLKSSAPSGSWTNNLSSGSPSSTYIGVANGTLPTGSVTTSEYGDFLVTAWADQSGNYNNMIADSGSEPTFISSELNGKPVIDFATNKYLTASFSSINFSQQTVFVVFKFVSENLSTYARPFSQSNIDYNDYQTPGNLLPLMRKDGTDDMWCYSPQDDTFLASLPTSNNTWYISTTKTNGINGSFLLNASNEQSFSAEFNADITNMRVGGSIFEGGSFNDPFNSKIAEVIVYNRALTISEIQQVEAYLNQKYQIY